MSQVLGRALDYQIEKALTQPGPDQKGEEEF
jgi:hypothetical protein